MPRDKTASHIQVMEAVRAEFLEKGFEKASVRRNVSSRVIPPLQKQRGYV